MQSQIHLSKTNSLHVSGSDLDLLLASAAAACNQISEVALQESVC